MKLSKIQIEEINNFLQCKPSIYKKGSKPKSEKKGKYFYDFNNIEAIRFRNLSRDERRNKVPPKDHLKRNVQFVDSILFRILSRFPNIDRPKNVSNIYHYTNAYNGIAKGGLRASNFLNNSNDVEEVTHLLDRMGLTDRAYVNIYNRSILKRYNSFSYKPIDKLAWRYYLNQEKREFNKIITTIPKIEGKFKKSASAKYLIHGFVRYGISGKANAIEYLNGIIGMFWSKGAIPEYMMEIIAIITTFVKRKCSDPSKKGLSFDNYDYSKESEYRFLYNDINENAIPYHKLEIEREWWHKCKEKLGPENNQCSLYH